MFTNIHLKSSRIMICFDFFCFILIKSEANLSCHQIQFISYILLSIKPGFYLMIVSFTYLTLYIEEELTSYFYLLCLIDSGLTVKLWLISSVSMFRKRFCYLCGKSPSTTFYWSEKYPPNMLSHVQYTCLPIFFNHILKQ